MNSAGKVCAVVVLALTWTAAPVAEAQTSIRIGASLAQTGVCYGAFRVDRDGVQIGHKHVLFQWQDGMRAIVWPAELAPGTPWFPTPPWSQRP